MWGWSSCRGELDLAQEPVGRDADQQLRVEDLEGDLAPVRVTGQEDARIAAFADLAIDLVLARKAWRTSASMSRRMA